MVWVRKARKLEQPASNGEAVIVRDPLLACVDDVHAKQLAVIHIHERQEVRHGRASVWFVAPAVAIRPTSNLIETTTAVMAILLRRGSS